MTLCSEAVLDQSWTDLPRLSGEIWFVGPEAHEVPYALY